MKNSLNPWSLYILVNSLFLRHSSSRTSRELPQKNEYPKFIKLRVGASVALEESGYFPVFHHCGLFFGREDQRSDQAYRKCKIWTRSSWTTRGKKKTRTIWMARAKSHLFIKSYRWHQIAQFLQWRTRFFKYQSIYVSTWIDNTFNKRRTSLHRPGR